MAYLHSLDINDRNILLDQHFYHFIDDIYGSLKISMKNNNDKLKSLHLLRNDNGKISFNNGNIPYDNGKIPYDNGKIPYDNGNFSYDYGNFSYDNGKIFQK